MSNPDRFIEEVTEEVRRDRLFNLMRRYGWIAIAAVVLLVVGAAYNEWQKARDTAAARAFGDAVLTAIEAPTPEERAAGLAAIQADDAGRALMLDLLSAGLRQPGQDVAASLATLGRISADATLPQAYRDLALIKRVLIAGDALPAPERDAALASLAEAGRPFRLLAMEQQALALVQSGDIAGALATIAATEQEPQASALQKRRLGQLRLALGGDGLDK